MKAGRFIVFLLLPILGLARNNCGTTFCRSDDIPISSPFWLSGQPQDCAFPGFDLSCNSDGIPVLDLSQSGSFLVRKIDYDNQEIQLYDSSGCIQSRLLKLNLSSSPFWSPSNKFYTFISCPTGNYRSPYKIDCLSDLMNSIFANSSEVTFPRPYSGCQVIAAREIPVPANNFISQPDLLLGDDLNLKWNASFCNLCETYIFCESTNSVETESDCLRYQEKKAKTEARRIEARRIDILGTIIGIACIFLCILCYKTRQATARARNSIVGVPLTEQRAGVRDAVTEQGARVQHLPQLGLNESIIKSYATIVVDHGTHIPGPNGSSCSICLAEYLPGDTLRSIPQCQHCYHVDCIDEWLRLKGICPICRKAPSADYLHS